MTATIFGCPTKLWLSCRALDGGLSSASPQPAAVVIADGSPTLAAAKEELVRGLEGMLGSAPPSESEVTADGAVVVGTPEAMPLTEKLDLPLDALEENGYVIQSVEVNGHPVTAIAANDDLGVLYGSVAFLRRLQTGEGIGDLDIASSPKLNLRLLNHWDNLDRTVERGYAGFSILDW